MRNITKMLLSAVLTICFSVASSGCNQSGNFANSDIMSTDSSVQSSTVSKTVESSIESIAESSLDSFIDSGDGKSSEEASKNESFEETSKNESSEEASKNESSENTDNAESTNEYSADTNSDIDDQKSKLIEQLNQISIVFSDESDVEKSNSVPDDSSVQVETDYKKNDGSIVVMLDPGHDDDTACSVRNHPELGVNEQELNLKIGQACYDRLKQYEGVTPYMTRYDGKCPNSDHMFSGEPQDCIHKRAYLADLADADVFVSLHCNAIDENFGTSANGVEVYVTNYPKFAAESTKLGEIILKHITDTVDFNSRGVISEKAIDSEGNYFKGFYDDGTVKDKLYLISHNIDYGRPSIVIEHGFMDNVHDNAILRDDDQLKLIGQADADAIAEYYGLKLK